MKLGHRLEGHLGLVGAFSVIVKSSFEALIIIFTHADMREDMETYDLQLIKLPHDVFCPRPPAYLMVPVLCFEGRNIDNLHTDTTLIGLEFILMPGILGSWVLYLCIDNWKLIMCSIH